MNDFAKNLLIVILLLISIVFIIMFFTKKPDIKYINQKEYVKVPEVKEVEKIQKVEIPIEKIKIVPKTEIKKEYVPQEVIKDNTKEVVTVVKAPCPAEGEIVITPILDKDQHEIQVYTKFNEKKFKFFDYKNFYIGYGYGYGSKLYNNISAGIEFNIVRYKNVHINVNAGFDVIDNSKLYDSILLKMKVDF